MKPGDPSATQVHACAVGPAEQETCMIRDCVAIARPDHWFKNIFMVPGVLLGWLAMHPEDPVGSLSWSSAGWLAVALLSTCLASSSNYVINELLDAPTDRKHRVKRHRPVPAGRIRMPLAYAEWVLLGLAGLWLAWLVGQPFFWVQVSFLVMAVLYNCPPSGPKNGRTWTSFRSPSTIRSGCCWVGSRLAAG